MRRKHFAGNLLRNFERKLEPVGDLEEQASPELFRRELIESEIAAHGAKRGGVLFEAAAVKGLFRKPSSREITRPAVDLPQPTFVFPGTAANVDVIVGQPGQICRQLLTVERRGLIEERIQAKVLEPDAYVARAVRNPYGS